MARRTGDLQAMSFGTCCDGLAGFTASCGILMHLDAVRVATELWPRRLPTHLQGGIFFTYVQGVDYCNMVQ